MKDDIKLPPLPYPQIPGNDYDPRDMWDYAIAAVKYDRQQRGEPVGELEPTFPAGNSNMLGGVYKLGFFSGQGIPVYTGPQPADPAQEPVCKTCGGSKVDPGGFPICRTCGRQHTTPAQGPSDAAPKFGEED